jgi:D-3-phosphoglycerate dehydrogenase
MDTTFTTYILDFDSTIITCESLDELARIALADNPSRQEIMSQLEALTAQGMAGTLAFDESLRQRLNLFSATQANITSLIAGLKDCITPSLLANRAWLEYNKEHIYIISGGFEEYIKPIIAMIGLMPEHVYANRFIFDGSLNITGYDYTRYTSHSGGKVAQAHVLELPHPLIAIGDGYTDYELKNSGEVDEFWAFIEHVERPEVVAEADHILQNFHDMPAARKTDLDTVPS